MKREKFYPKRIEVGRGLRRLTRTANGRLDYKKVIDKIIHNGFTLKCMAAKKEYSRIHYNATSLLIVMLSAHEIKVYPLNG